MGNNWGLEGDQVKYFPLRSFNNTFLLSFHIAGKRVGWVYLGQLGGGYIVGQVNTEGDITGDNIAYIYPDFRTAIRGTWCEGRLVSGHLVSVISSCVTEAGIIIPVFSETINPSQSYR